MRNRSTRRDIKHSRRGFVHATRVNRVWRRDASKTCFTTLHYNAALESCRLHYVIYNRRRISLNQSTIRKWISRSQLVILTIRLAIVICVWYGPDDLCIAHGNKNILFKSCSTYSNYMRHICHRWNTYAAAKRKLAQESSVTFKYGKLFFNSNMYSYCTGRKSVNNEFEYYYETSCAMLICSTTYPLERN